MSGATKRHTEIKWLASQAKPFFRQHLAGIALILISGLFVVLDPILVKFLIDDVLPQRRVGWLVGLLSLLGLTYVGRIAFDVCGQILCFRTLQRMMFKVRLRLLRRLQLCSAEYYDKNILGDLMHRLDQDVTLATEMSGQMLTFVLRTVFNSSLILIAMSFINVRLAAMVLPMIPVFLLLRRSFQKRLRDASDSVQQQAGKVTGFLQDHLAAISQVQLLCRELMQARMFAGLSGGLTRTQVNRYRIELLFASASSSVIVIAILSVLSFGSYQVLYGSLTVGGLVAFYSYSVQLFGPLYGVMDIYSKFQRVAASIRRLIEIDDAVPSVRDPLFALPFPSNNYLNLEFRNVSFSYHNQPAVRDLNLRLEPGEKLALVGPSGSGKSTIARLIVRLYDVSAGTILVNGIDVRHVKLEDLRSAIALVPQEPVLFNATLRENLLYGNPNATMVELEDAIAIAQLHDLVGQLPKGWDEPVGSRGSKLSGGERQRLALARVILRRPRILVFDECTSALDSTTEKLLLNSINRYALNKSAVIISHRLSTIMWADRILLIVEGQAAGSGSHRELYQQNSLYRNLCDNQFEMEGRREIGDPAIATCV